MTPSMRSWPAGNIIYNGTYRTCEQNGGEDPSQVRVTEEINGFVVWNCIPDSAGVVYFFTKWERNQAIEAGVDLACKLRTE